MQINSIFQHHLLEQFIFSDIGADVPANLAGSEQKSHSVSVDANIVADGGEILCALTDQRANQVFRNTAQAEAANHDGRAIGYVADRFIGAGNNFIHSEEILMQIHHGDTEDTEHRSEEICNGLSP